MPSYRDDVQETAVASSSTKSRFRYLIESISRSTDGTLSRIFTKTSETASASDSWRDHSIGGVEERAIASDSFEHTVRRRSEVSEAAKCRDALRHGVRTVTTELAGAEDTVRDHAQTRVHELAHAGDEVQSRRYASTLVLETAKARDSVLQAFSAAVEEVALAADEVLSRVRARSSLADAAAAHGEALDVVRASSVRVSDAASVHEEFIFKLRARNVLQDGAVAEDEVLQPGSDYGQAWTASADGWAMSRYAPFTFTGLAVINGAVYATASDGVYALDALDETMVAELRTGMLDMTGSVQAHPVEAHLEYELDGTADVEVSTTQAGDKLRSFRYPLSSRPAAVLTNGRALFGRGLRARHFSYALRINGRRAYINDWRVLSALSKRSL